MSPDCDDCERLPLEDYTMRDIIGHIGFWTSDLLESNIVELEEITREWREQHG